MGMNIIFLLAMVIFFYFMILRPQKKRQTEYKNMLDKIKVGDNIVTIEGIHGKIIKIEEDKVYILTGTNKKTKLVMLKTAISNIK